MTTTIYTLTNNRQCRQAVHFLETSHIPFKEVRLVKEIDLSIIKQIASRIDDIDEIISLRCLLYPAYKTLAGKRSTKMSDIFQFIVDNPKILRVPIIMNEKAVQIGYNPDEIGTFLPRSVKKRAFLASLEEARKRDRIVFVEDQIVEDEEVEEEVEAYARETCG